MSPLLTMRKPFIVYYHVVLDPCVCQSIRPKPTTSMQPYFGETGYDIISRLQLDDAYLLFTSVSLIRPPDTKFIFEPPDLDVNGLSLKLAFFLGDMMQWEIPISFLDTVKRWNFCGENIECPPRQHFHFDVRGGDDRMWDGRDFWIAFEGLRTRRLELEPISISVGKEDDE